MLRVGLGLLAAVVCALGVARADDVQGRFKQDRFAIGFWVDPPFDHRTDARYKEIADAGFNVVLGLFGAKGADFSKFLGVVEKHGLKAIANVDGVAMDKWPDSPSCWGYHIVDEPNAGAFPSLAKVVADTRKAYPGRFAYINLLPNYASPGQLGSENYDAHVARFVSEVNPDVLCMDHYPVFKPEGDGRDGYCANLEAMRKYSLQAGIPFWNFFNSMPYGPHTDPTEAQLRWQVFTTIAYGAKGVLYFCYFTPRGGEFPKGGAIIAADGSRTRHYEHAKRLNKQIGNLGPTLMKLTSTGVYRIDPKADPAKVLEGSGIANIKRDWVDPPNDYLVGSFRHEDGRRAVMLCNYRFAFSAWPTVEFDVPDVEVREVDKETGALIRVRDDSPDMPGLQLSLADGEGRLFLLPPVR